MNDLPLVSVIVPVYNAERYLERCLKSIAIQEYTNLEIIIVNDGSVDQSKHIIDDFAIKDKRVVVFNKNNGGASSARNKGIKAANGEYIAFIDADDIIHKTYIYNLTSDLIKSGADIVTTSAMVMNLTDDEFLSLEYDKSATYREYTPSQALLALYKGTLEKGINGQQMFRRSLIKHHNLQYDSTMTIREDFNYLARAIVKSNKVVLDNRDMYYYRLNETSALHTASLTRHYEGMINQQRLGRDLGKEFPEIIDTVNNNLVFDSISCGVSMLDNREDYKVEYEQIVANINKYKYKTLFDCGGSLSGRIKVLIIVIFGIKIGLNIVKVLIKMKGLRYI